MILSPSSCLNDQESNKIRVPQSNSKQMYASRGRTNLTLSRCRTDLLKLPRPRLHFPHGQCLLRRSQQARCIQGFAGEHRRDFDRVACPA